MVTVLIQHAVRDFAGWKIVFDGVFDERKAAGEKSAQVFHGEHDTHNVIALFKWDSSENAHKFFESDFMKDNFEEAGILTKPKIQFLTEI